MVYLVPDIHTVMVHIETQTHHFGFKWRLDLSVRQAVPVDASEEGLLPDVHLALWPAAETLGRVFGHQLVTNTKRRDQRMRRRPQGERERM